MRQVLKRINTLKLSKVSLLKKKIDGQSEEVLLNEIRNGNRDAIPKLVDSWEHVIISCIAQQDKNIPLSIEDMIDLGRKALTRLAEAQIGSTGRETYTRFGAWWVKQSFLNIYEIDKYLMNYIMNIIIPKEIIFINHNLILIHHVTKFLL